MADYRVVSSDSHIIEPTDLWTTRIEAKYRDRCPQIQSLEGGEFWVCDGRPGNGLASGTNAGRRFEAPEELEPKDVFENVRPGAYIPEEHVKDMDLDGVDVSVIYPTAGLVLYGTVPDTELLTAVFSTYNNFAAEFCGAFPKRLRGIAMINLDDVQAGVKELERCGNMGFAGAMITVFPPAGRRYESPEYEPLWAAAQDLDIPLSLHSVTNRVGSGEGFQGLDPSNTRAHFVNMDYGVRMSLAHIILSGVFERHPKLQIGAVEHELSWVPHFLDRLDYNYAQRATSRSNYRFNEDMFPSDYFHRNVFLGFQEDSLGIKLRHIIGVDLLQWGSDYPHPESTFPRSRGIIEEILADCTEEEKAKIAGGNASRVYHLD